ncbi:MAG: proprotein convertase P-domain-containing protein [Verrucomicrobiota bacterium]
MAEAQPYSNAGSGFSSFLGLNPNGNWRLFVADLNSGDMMTVNSWGLHLELSAVPEPSEWAALSLGVLGVVWVVKRRFMPGRA